MTKTELSEFVKIEFVYSTFTAEQLLTFQTLAPTEVQCRRRVISGPKLWLGVRLSIRAPNCAGLNNAFDNGVAGSALTDEVVQEVIKGGRSKSISDKPERVTGCHRWRS